MPMLSSLFSFWSDLTPSEVSFLEQSARTEIFPQGKLIHRSEDDCRGLMAVITGSLRVYCVSDEGREVTLYRVESGEICVLSASCLMDSVVFDVLIETVEEARVCMIPAVALHQVEKKNPLVELYIYKNAVQKFSEVLWTIQQVLFMKIDQRIALALYDEMIRQKSKVISIRHEDLAKQIGSVREVVSKTLKYLEQEGVVSLGRGKIEILDEMGLKNGTENGIYNS